MKAAVYYETGPPDVFRYEDVPDPECYPGGVLIEVEAISIEGGDTLNRAGGEMATTPHVVGYQCAGHHPRGRRGRRRPLRRPAGRGHDAVGLARRAGRDAGGRHLADPRRRGPRRVPRASRSRSAPRTTACSSSGTSSGARRC